MLWNSLTEGGVRNQAEGNGDRGRGWELADGADDIRQTGRKWQQGIGERGLSRTNRGETVTHYREG